MLMGIAVVVDLALLRTVTRISLVGTADPPLVGIILPTIGTLNVAADLALLATTKTTDSASLNIVFHVTGSSSISSLYRSICGSFFRRWMMR